MLSHRIKYLAISVFFLTFYPLSGQKTLIDSLKQKKIAIEGKSEFNESNTDYIDLLNKLSRSYIYHNNDSLKFYSNKALELSKSIDYKKGIAGAKLALGEFYVLSSEFEPGFKLIVEARGLAKEVRADSIFLRSLNSDAMGHFMNGEYPEAYKLCKEGEKYAKEFNNHEMQITFAMNLATSFSILKIYQQALPYYQKALDAIADKPDKDLEGQIRSNMGYLYMHIEDFDKGKSACKRAIDIFRENKFHSWEAFAWTTLGEIAVKEKNPDEALGLFNVSDSLLMLAKDSQRQAENYLGIAEAYLLKNDLQTSKDFAEKGTQISKQIKNHNGIVKGSKLLYEIATTLNQPKEALIHLQAANKISDSILESDDKTRFLLLETQNQFLRDAEKMRLENDRKIKDKNFIFYIALLALIALIIIALLVRKSALAEKNANRILEENNEIKDKIFSIIGHDLKSPVGTLQELLELYSSKEISEEEISRYTPKLKENVDYNSFMLNNLLIWAKSHMDGGIEVFPEKINLRSVLKDKEQLFKKEIQEKKISLKIEVPKSQEVLFDMSHLRLILKNIISNALKYTENMGRIKISSEAHDNHIQLTIEDNGVGVSKEVLNAINSDKFIKSKPGTRMEKGTGLGLQISKDLASLNNGSLVIKGNVGEGTTVILKFPKA
ncbi:tetratricopeptide repeat-containing sensor histidine kinase [Croceivirga thetidis]|uniref:histidine kinase n=1 Tax=Croceivirga thetidis TaxID=2721623 RepID=A0ABX1GQA4_9FLAO|nr:tetratricopeptide repeat-containing sensor histidine kinase [Croceivirga thetidis]NKI32090.1 hypothetical protein [Croceivirga thetidis]